MRYSYNWLKDISGASLSAQEIAELITMHSFEVEEFEKVGGSFEKIVVGEILEIEKHPNADKLQITKVDVGKEKLQIVCGANNISVGDKVPVALVGAKMSAGFEIKEAEIRGVKSFGMLCALDELGLGTDHSGIMLLDKSLEIGTVFSEIVSGADTIFEIKILPDRAHDALSHVGMAREIAALTGSKIDYDYNGLILPKVILLQLWKM
jgi:phenylalanyl-tRNA synthetase beta chain